MNVAPEDEDIVAIPEYLDSLQTMEFLGFNKDQAKWTWEDYQQTQEMFSFKSLIDNAKRNLWSGYSQDAVQEDDDWDEIMRRLCIDGDLRERIMTKGFEQIRLTKTAHAWVRQTIIEKYDFLSSLDERIYNRPRNGPLAAKPNETILWQGGMLFDLQDVGDPKVRYDDELMRLYPLEDSMPGMYQRCLQGVRLFKDRELAELHARWAGVRLNKKVIPVGVLGMVVPNDLLQNALDISRDPWEPLLWHSTGTIKESEVPEDLRDRFDELCEAEVTLLPVVKESQKQILRRKEKDPKCSGRLNGWFLSNGELALQYCISQSGKLCREFEKRCRVWVEQL